MSPYESVNKKLRVFVGRGFSHDLNAVSAARLQPLKYRFRSCRCDAMRPNHANH